jgi:hypothetical protein
MHYIDLEFMVRPKNEVEVEVEVEVDAASTVPLRLRAGFNCMEPLVDDDDIRSAPVGTIEKIIGTYTRTPIASSGGYGSQDNMPRSYGAGVGTSANIGMGGAAAGFVPSSSTRGMTSFFDFIRVKCFLALASIGG